MWEWIHSSQPRSSCLQSLIMSASERHLCRYNCLVNKTRNIRLWYIFVVRLQPFYATVSYNITACQTDRFVRYPVCIFAVEWISAVRAFTFGRHEDVFEAPSVSYCSVETWIRRNLQWISISPAFVLNVLPCVWQCEITEQNAELLFIYLFFHCLEGF